jgi:hypothetical protein
MQEDPKEKFVVRVFGTLIGIPMFLILFLVVGIGMPLMFFGSVHILLGRIFSESEEMGGYPDILYIGIAIAAGYVAWKFWEGFIATLLEQFKSFKQWLNRDKK